MDRNWQEHLREDDDLRSGISLMAHAQKDPLIEYKRKSFEAFREMLLKVNQEALEFIFKANIEVQRSEEEERKQKEKERVSSLKLDNKEKKKQPVVKKSEDKIKRNDPCPCGSGEKYKNCHGK